MDPAHEVGVLVGIFSYFGSLIWAASAACCFIAWGFLSRASRFHPLRSWFLASALMSGALTIDDTFVIHDRVLPEYLGIPEILVLSGYFIAIGWYLVRFRHELLNRADSAVFLISVLFLAASLGFDVIHAAFPFGPSIEDLAKLLGVTAWLYFFFRATLDTVTQTHLASELSQ